MRAYPPLFFPLILMRAYPPLTSPLILMRAYPPLSFPLILMRAYPPLSSPFILSQCTNQALHTCDREVTDALRILAEECCVEGGSGRGMEECCGEGVGGREISVHAIRGGGRARDEYKRQEAEGSNAGTGDTRLCEDRGHLSRAAAPLTVACSILYIPYTRVMEH